MTSTNTNAVLEAVEVDVSPKLAAHGDAITLNPKLFRRIDTLYAKRDKLALDAESLRLCLTRASSATTWAWAESTLVCKSLGSSRART